MPTPGSQLIITIVPDGCGTHAIWVSLRDADGTIGSSRKLSVDLDSKLAGFVAAVEAERYSAPSYDFLGFFSAILSKRRIASGRDSGSLSRDSQSSTAASSSGGNLTPISGAPLPSLPS
jgi:hypothetical protein